MRIRLHYMGIPLIILSIFTLFSSSVLSQKATNDIDSILCWKGERCGAFGPTGEALYGDHIITAPGFQGIFCYASPQFKFQDPLSIKIMKNDEEVNLNLDEAFFYPSHLDLTWKGGGLTVNEKKFITQDDILGDQVTVVNCLDSPVNIDVLIYGKSTPSLERIRSKQTFIDLSTAANLAPRQDDRLYTRNVKISRIWIEGEKPLSPKGEKTEVRLAASGGACLGITSGHLKKEVDRGSPYWDPDLPDKFVYKVQSPSLKSPTLLIRFSRSQKGQARIFVTIDSNEAEEITFESTNGEGDKCRHWRYLEFSSDLLTEGEHLISFSAAQDDAQIRMDGFFLAEQGSLTPTLLHGGAFESEYREQLPISSGIIVLDGIKQLIPRFDKNDVPTIIALKGGLDQDRSSRFPKGISFSIPEAPTGVSTIYLLSITPSPRGKPGSDLPPAYYIFRLDDKSEEKVPWPSTVSDLKGFEPPFQNIRGHSERVGWRFFKSQDSDTPLLRLAYMPPPNRFIKEVGVQKGAGRQIPLVLAATMEIQPESERIHGLVGQHSFYDHQIHTAMTGADFKLTDSLSGDRKLSRTVSLNPGSEAVFNIVIATGKNGLPTILRALDCAEDNELFNNHVKTYPDWFLEKVPEFSCSDPFIEKAWFYRWFLVRRSLPALHFRDFQSSRFGALRCGLSHALTECRWLRDKEIVKQCIENEFKIKRTDRLSQNGRDHSKGVLFTHFIHDAVLGCYDVARSNKLLEDAMPHIRSIFEDDLYMFDNEPDYKSMELDTAHSGTSTSAHDGELYKSPQFASYLYSSAKAHARVCRILGKTDDSSIYEKHAEQIKESVLKKMWSEKDRAFYSISDKNNEQTRSHKPTNYYPFFSLLAPDEKMFVEALDRLLDQKESWTSLPIASMSKSDGQYSSSQGLHNDSDRLTPHLMHADAVFPGELTMAADVMANAINYYNGSSITQDDFSQFFTYFTKLHFEGAKLDRPIILESYNNKTYEGYGCPDTLQSTYCDLLIRFLAGLTPSKDDSIELKPMIKGIDHFRFRGIPYHGELIDITWDRPDFNRIYKTAPEGYTLSISGKVIFNSKELKNVVIKR